MLSSMYVVSNSSILAALLSSLLLYTWHHPALSDVCFIRMPHLQRIDHHAGLVRLKYQSIPCVSHQQVFARHVDDYRNNQENQPRPTNDSRPGRSH
jgi:hypothetical protein